uniref:Uncharacterized protein n=1 Tax=Schistosoma haematobium TaxID=6185 RepID=A0A095A173_SCHHA
MDIVTCPLDTSHKLDGTMIATWTPINTNTVFVVIVVVGKLLQLI